jgi:hypothetical protein
LHQPVFAAEFDKNPALKERTAILNEEVSQSTVYVPAILRLQRKSGMTVRTAAIQIIRHGPLWAVHADGAWYRQVIASKPQWGSPVCFTLPLAHT